MHASPASGIQELLKKPAVCNLARSIALSSGLSLGIYSPGGHILLHYGNSRHHGHVDNMPEPRGLFPLPENPPADGPPVLTEEKAFGDLHFSLMRIRNNGEFLALVALGPWQQKKGLKETVANTRLLRSLGEVILGFYHEKEHSLQYINRMSTLYEISNRINSTLRTEDVLKFVLENALLLLKAKAGSIMLIEQALQEMRIFMAVGLSEDIVKHTVVKMGEGISGNVAKSGKPRLLLKGVRESRSLSSRRLEEIDSAICVPLKVKDKVLGVLNVSGRVDGDNFSPQDLKLLNILASNAAVAINHAKLYAGISEKASQLKALYKIGTSVTSSMEKRKVLQEVLRSAKHLLKAKKGSVMLLDREAGHLTIEVAYGLPPWIVKNVRPRLGEGIAGKTALEGTPRLLEKGIKVLESKTEKEEKEIPSAISVPIRIKDKVLGVLNVSDNESGENFTLESMELLSMLASQAAVAIENSMLMEELQELFVQSITALANAIDARDTYTRGHSQRVTEYSMAIARKMGVSKEERELVQYAALLHDIGKIHIRDDILHKPGKLSDDEFEEMQRHPEYGAKIMEPVGRFRTMLPYMYHHHEKYAGKGYPYHLKGIEIPLAARIISVADSFDAMTSDRPYRRGKPVDEALEELIKCRGTQFDPEVVDAFVKYVKERRPGYIRELIKQTM
ncbi:MAG: GAF domain-containing protein [Candidatus Eremiobacteraeota bacterium]|nr:GAF domain-containing protein [Candidatus Eremiobacteraeota bacterium]